MSGGSARGGSIEDGGKDTRELLPDVRTSLVRRRDRRSGGGLRSRFRFVVLRRGRPAFASLGRPLRMRAMSVNLEVFPLRQSRKPERCSPWRETFSAGRPRHSRRPTLPRRTRPFCAFADDSPIPLRACACSGKLIQRRQSPRRTRLALPPRPRSPPRLRRPAPRHERRVDTHPLRRKMSNSGQHASAHLQSLREEKGNFFPSFGQRLGSARRVRKFARALSAALVPSLPRPPATRKLLSYAPIELRRPVPALLPSAALARGARKLQPGPASPAARTPHRSQRARPPH